MRFVVFSAAFVGLLSAPAWAAGGTPRADRSVGEASVPSDQAAAREHFERALSLYRAGKYQRALDELNAALVSDPAGKDLVFNLALVQEKLGDFSAAIASLERFEAMEKDPAELERAAQTIERLKGVRTEFALSLPPCPPPRVRGKFDAWVLGTGGTALASLLVGTVFGVRALSLDSQAESAVSLADSHDRAARAHTAALVADIAFSASVLAGASAATLYFGRYADVPPPREARVSLPLAPVTAAWLEIHY